MNMRFIFPLFFILIILSNANAYEITSYVNDNAYVFDDDIRVQLINHLEQFEKEHNSTQIVIFTESDIPDGMTLEERTLQLAQERAIGDKEEDNGLLFYLAVNDRKFRWEVGYGLEPVLNSAWLGRMSRDHMVPDFQQGNYASGIIAGLEQVETRIVSEYNEAGTSRVENELSSVESFFKSNPKMALLIILLIMLIIVKAATRKYPSGAGDYFFIASATNLFGKGGFGGGGFSGGGGSFGGGGFSGGY